MIYFWRSTVRDHAETRRRVYLLYSLLPWLTAMYQRATGITRIYFQDAKHRPEPCGARSDQAVAGSGC